MKIIFNLFFLFLSVNGVAQQAIPPKPVFLYALGAGAQEITIEELSGRFKGLLTVAGNTIVIHADSSCIFLFQTNTINGSFTINKNLMNLEGTRILIGNLLQEKVRSTGYIIEFKLMVNGDEKESRFDLFKDDRNFILYQHTHIGTDLIFSKKIE